MNDAPEPPSVRVSSLRKVSDRMARAAGLPLRRTMSAVLAKAEACGWVVRGGWIQRQPTAR